MHPLSPIFLFVAVVKRFRAERLAQSAAALSFATLLGLVPMIIVAASLIDHIPYGAGIASALEKFILANLLPEKAGAVIAKVVGHFADRASGVTLAGVGLLVVTAVTQMLTIEHALNAIWKIKSPRPLLRRLVVHGVVLITGPLVFGVSIATTTYLLSASLGVVNEAPWVATLLVRTLAFMLLAGLLAFVYWGVPNRRVPILPAVVAGTLSATGFLLMQKLFATYVINFPSYTLIYGSFSAVPIFLAWLYTSWVVLLVGALVAAEMPGVVHHRATTRR